MALPRVIPVLLLRNKGLVKTIKFKDHRYVGDPINAVKIFNEKGVDELCFLDIDASREHREPNYNYLSEIASECFMPLSYGGAITSVDQMKRLIQSGIEKMVLNTVALENPEVVRQAADAFGSSTIVGAMDVKKNMWGKYQVYAHPRKTTISLDPVAHAEQLQRLGVGEIFLNNVDHDGMMNGYDLELVSRITHAVDVPVIACGGCSSIHDIDKVINQSHAAAAAAGSFFVFHGKHRAVLITYPEFRGLNAIFNVQH
ncbi:MAG: AglZ/HisF2 family acetamidino modification protein [Cyclobacteriaceae bacterium]